jgi:hypothetical protein
MCRPRTWKNLLSVATYFGYGIFGISNMLDDLQTKGIITQAEFETQKAKILPGKYQSNRPQINLNDMPRYPRVMTELLDATGKTIYPNQDIQNPTEPIPVYIY